jgi:signal transduction histidine kinase/ActR/RegA family two-component response regulator
VLNMIGANMRTEELLQQSQSLTQELQSQSNELTTQQAELRRTNTELEKQALELEEKARLLAEQNTKVEVKNREVEQARRSLEEKAEQLSTTSKYKSEFLANMSHELRTPLNSLLILAKLLADNAETHLSAKEVEYAKTIYASGGDLLTLINEILDLSKVEAGKMPIDPRDIHPTEIADFVDRSFRPLAEQKGLGFSVDVEIGVARSLYTDPQRLQQVLKNLLANAFKFTADGSVTLRIHRPEPDTHFSNPSLAFERVVAFSVVDTGIGIPENKQGLIFEAFQQADGTTSRRYGGTGLGLTISRDIARHLGGEIHVESRPGQGSVFTLYLPERYIGLPAPDEERGGGRRELERSATPPSVPQFAALEPSVLAAIAGRRVLVVDDDVRNVFAMTSALEAAGLEVVYADNGQAGIDTLAADPEIDLVLMDVMMPGKDGYETIRTIRANPDWHEMPIVAVTAKALEDDRDKCLEAGASDYLPKPVDVNRLLNLIRHLAAAPEGPEAS